MQIAPLITEHSALLITMQVAYPSSVEENRRPYRVRREKWLLHWLQEVGGPKALASALESTDTHLTAMSKGRRNVGDDLADKMEAHFGLPHGATDEAAPGESDRATETGSPTTPTLTQALESVVAAISALPQPARKALAEDLALLAVAPGDAETRQRVANALQTGPSMAQRLLAIPSQVESPRLPQRATEK